MKTNHAPFQEVLLPPAASRGGAASPLPLPGAFIGCAADALTVLRGFTIAVIGCGSVGGRIALLLARMELGGLLLVDPKRYKIGSLATHEIGPNDVGQYKAMSVGRRCKATSPRTSVLGFAGPVEALDLAALADVELVVMAPDLLSVELELAQRCLWLSKPLVQASVHGSTLTAQVRFFLNAKETGGCPVCCYGRDELKLMTRQVRFSCEGARTANGTAPPAEGLATNSLGALCSLAADLAVIQVLRFLLRLGQPVADTMLEYNGFTHRSVISPITRNPNCPLEHASLAQVQVAGPLAELSLAQLAQRAGVPLTSGAQFELAYMDWLEFAGCRCAKPTPVRKFVRRGGTELGVCAKCTTPFVPLSFYNHRSVSARVLGAALEQPLHKLGARRVGSVVLRAGDTGMLIRQQTSPERTASVIGGAASPRRPDNGGFGETALPDRGNKPEPVP